MTNFADPIFILTYAVCALLVIIYLNIRYRPNKMPQYDFEMKNATALIPDMGHVNLQVVRSRNLGIINSDLVARLKASGMAKDSFERLNNYIGRPLIEFQAQTERGTKIFYNTDCIITSPEQLNNAYTIIDFDARSDVVEVIKNVTLLNRNIMTYKAQLDMQTSDHYSATSRMGDHVKSLRKQIGGGMMPMPMRQTGAGSYSSGTMPLEGGEGMG